MSVAIPTTIEPLSTVEIKVTIDTSKVLEEKIFEILHLFVDGEELTTALNIAANIIIKH